MRSSGLLSFENFCYADQGIMFGKSDFSECRHVFKKKEARGDADAQNCDARRPDQEGLWQEILLA